MINTYISGFKRIGQILKIFWDLKKSSLENEKDRINFVIAKFIFFFVLLFGTISSAYLFCDFIKDYLQLNRQQILYAQIFSIALTSTGALGKREWGFPSIKSCQKSALVEERISELLTIIGFWIFCITVIIELF